MERKSICLPIIITGFPVLWSGSGTYSPHNITHTRPQLMAIVLKRNMDFHDYKSSSYIYTVHTNLIHQLKPVSQYVDRSMMPLLEYIAL